MEQKKGDSEREERTVMWVQPKFRQPTFLLKPIRAIGFIIKPEEVEKRRVAVCGS